MSNYRKGSFDRPRDLPPLREQPSAEDGHDTARADFNYQLWCGQDDVLRPAERQIEENIRMLHGQQWIVWSRLKGRYVNLLDTLDDDERRWRHMPVLNRLFLWFVLLHSRMTENPPVIAWQSGPDRKDKLLAEVCDPLFKYFWDDTQMLEILDRLIAWMIPAGRAYLKTRLDAMKGEPLPQTGPGLLDIIGSNGSPLVGADGVTPLRKYVEEVEYAPNPKDPEGAYVPTQRFVGDDEESAELQPIEGLKPELLYEGGLEVDVLMPLEVRGEWGHNIPWHKKAWHMQKSLLTPLQAWETFGLELEPDVRGQEAENASMLWRLLQTSGLFGAADGKRADTGDQQEFVTIYESWHRPGRMQGTERTPDSPGGRLLITTGGGKVLRDGVRPAPFRYTSPIRSFDFVGLPGRPQGTSAQEFLNGPVRTRNRLHAQILGNATLMANPIRIGDRSQGIEEGQIPNTPGAEILVDRSRSQAPPVEYVQPPALGSDVYNAADRLLTEIDQMGQISGQESTPPTDDSSGELVKELRFNSDRPIAATMKRIVIELGRLGEDWFALAPLMYDREKIIEVVGDDSIARTITVYPDLFRQGLVNAKPEVESMLPEGRGERQARAEKMWQAGVWGPADTPQAIAAYLDEARFPHMGRLTRPGGADRATAEQNIGKLMDGIAAAEIPLFPWYDHALHRWVLEQYMKAPEYLKLAPGLQAQFLAFWQMLLDAEDEAALMLQGRQLDLQTSIEADQLARQTALRPLADAARSGETGGGGAPKPAPGAAGA